ncbi:MAG: DUF512 domain-containing protein [Nitrospiria bacterium]
MAEHQHLQFTIRGGLAITSVEGGSIAEETGIVAGDRLVSLNGQDVKDILDYRFRSDEEKLFLELVKPNGEVWEVDVEKGYNEDMGLGFEEMKIRQCPNKCAFCFVDQMPEGQRRGLYIRDEDYRFSFLFGNYITLTNLTRKDKARIFEQKMSPLYISVHTTDLELRRELLKNRHARDILTEIKEMTDHGITLHTQIVLCPGVNDGAALSKSIEDLAGFYPDVASLAIVPVGLTRHRKGLPEIEEVTVDYAKRFLDDFPAWQERFQKELSTPFVFAADEWFVKADVPFPPLERYLDLAQIENGVGMVPLFMKEFQSLSSDLLDKFSAKTFPGPSRISIATGISFSSYLEDCVNSLDLEGLNLEVVPVTNHFFGDSVTVTGLLTGGDITKAIKKRRINTLMRSDDEILLIPSVTLNDEGKVFLDGTTPQDIAREIETPVHVVPSDAGGLIKFLHTIPELLCQ